MRKPSRVVLAGATAVLAVSALSAPATGGGIGPDSARSPSAGASASPDLPQRPVVRQPSAPIIAPAGAVKAVVVKSWGQCSSRYLVWDDLNANWATYGSQPIVIDYADPSLCGNSLSLADLRASKADVVILSNPGGFGRVYSPDDIAALTRYLEEGHDLIGTFLTIGSISGRDNPALGPLFGLVEDGGWKAAHGSPAYRLRSKHEGALKSLFRGLSNPYVSQGHTDRQAPGDDQWSFNERAGARIMAISRARQAAITLYTRSSYNAVSIANMPEYGGGPQDKQFLYNAIIYPSRG